MRPPVFLRRRKPEPVDVELQKFYAALLPAIDRPVFREGEWQLCDRSGWPDNASFENLVAWTWQDANDRYLIVVNLSDRRSQAEVRLPWTDLARAKVTLTDVLSGATYDRDGSGMLSAGVYVDLESWNYHFFRCSTTKGG